MSRLKTLLRHERRQAAVVASLGFATALCTMMLAARSLYAEQVGHLGLQWNLFLAWLPMLGALVAYNLGKRGGRRAWPLILPFLAGWLLFFPNAPYILTDFINLTPRGRAVLVRPADGCVLCPDRDVFGARLALPDAIAGAPLVWRGHELGLHAGSSGRHGIRRLSRPLPALEQLGRADGPQPRCCSTSGRGCLTHWRTARRSCSACSSRCCWPRCTS